MIYIITGESVLERHQAIWVDGQIRGLKVVTALITGAAEGVDSVSLVAGIQEFPEARHVIIRPAAPYNRAVDHYLNHVHDAHKEVEAFASTGPKGRTASESYMLRNDAMVAKALEMADGQTEEIRCVGFPFYATDTLRSGTWATLRRARTAGIELDVRELP